MEWQEITVKTTEELTDAVSEIFYDLGAGGVVLEDPKVYAEYIESGEWDYHAIPEELLKREYVIVKGYLPVDEELLCKEEELQNRLAYLSHLFPCTLLEVSFANISEEDWAHAWKAYYKPHKIGNIVIKPTWEDYKPAQNELIIELDPGMAFGTGTHPTTEMVLEYLQETVREGDIAADVGTGSGVLAIAAAKLGAKHVYALDIDGVALNSASENISLNKVSESIEVKKSDLLTGFTEQVNLIIANIVADVIIRLLPQAQHVLKTGGKLIASGIIEGRVQDVLDAAQKNGFNVLSQKKSGEWVAMCLTR